MADMGSKLSDVQRKATDIQNAPAALRQSAGSGVDKALSPLAQKKMEIDAALQKANQPFDTMKARQQQVAMSMETAKKQADSAKKALEAKELLHGMANDVSSKTMNDAQSTLASAKQGIESRQQDFQNAGAFVQDLEAKLAAALKGAGETGNAPGIHQ